MIMIVATSLIVSDEPDGIAKGGYVTETAIALI